MMAWALFGGLESALWFVAVEANIASLQLLSLCLPVPVFWGLEVEGPLGKELRAEAIEMVSATGTKATVNCSYDVGY